jgi:hypothetical protein
MAAVGDNVRGGKDRRLSFCEHSHTVLDTLEASESHRLIAHVLYAAVAR